MTTTIGADITPAKFTLVKKTKYETSDYEVLVGFVKDGELPQYVVRNKDTDVIEFNHEVLSFAREWISHFQKRLDDLNSGKTPDSETAPAPGNVAFN